jgi:hypothetical protein
MQAQQIDSPNSSLLDAACPVETADAPAAVSQEYFDGALCPVCEGPSVKPKSAVQEIAKPAATPASATPEELEGWNDFLHWGINE